jgi:hypothetical protein
LDLTTLNKDLRAHVGRSSTVARFETDQDAVENGLIELRALPRGASGASVPEKFEALRRRRYRARERRARLLRGVVFVGALGSVPVVALGGLGQVDAQTVMVSSIASLVVGVGIGIKAKTGVES